METTRSERLSALHDRELGADEAARLSREIADDAEALALLAAFDAVDCAARDAFDADLDAPVPLALAQGVRRGFAARRRAALAQTALRWIGPVAAAIAIVVVGNHWSTQRVEDALALREAQIAALADRAVQDALEHALSGAAVSVADAGIEGQISITPVRTYRSESQHWCREFVEELTVDGDKVTRFGLACREPDGEWRRVQTKLNGSKPPLVGATL